MMPKSFLKSIFYCCLFLMVNTIQLEAQDRPSKPFKNKSTPPTTQPNLDPLIPKEEKDTSDIVTLEKANEIEVFNKDGEEIRFLKGGIVLTQNDAIFYSDSAYLYTNQNAISAWKEVTIVQKDTINVFSDTLKYFGDTKDAYLIGNVVLTDTTQQLFTQRLDYNMETKVAKYFYGGVIKTATTQLTSESCIYNSQTNNAFFKDSVLVINDEFTLKTDSLNYNTQTQFSEFLGPTLILQDSAKIYTESGFYDYENKYAEFDKNPQYIKGDRTALANFMKYDGKSKQVFLEGDAKFKENNKFASADKMIYNEETDETRLEGNAYFKDEENEVNADVIIYDGKNKSYTTEGKTIAKSEGNFITADNTKYDAETKTRFLDGNVYIVDKEQTLKANEVQFNEETDDAFARGKVYWKDSVNQITIRTDDLYFNKETEYVKAIGRPIMTSILDGDTLYLSADTLISEKLILPNQDTLERLIAYRDVRIFKNDFQAVCDSMVYNVTDSLFSFYYQPVIWSDSTQFSADTTRFTLKNERIDSVFLLHSSLIIDTPDEQFFNQIKGRNITVKFNNNEPQNMFVNGNSESVYYVLDDDEGYVGPNKTTCSDMYMAFIDGELNKIRFYGEPTSNLIPMKEANHEQLKLKGFKWDKQNRPMSPADLHSHHYIVGSELLKINK